MLRPPGSVLPQPPDTITALAWHDGPRSPSAPRQAHEPPPELPSALPKRMLQPRPERRPPHDAVLHTRPNGSSPHHLTRHQRTASSKHHTTTPARHQTNSTNTPSHHHCHHHATPPRAPRPTLPPCVTTSSTLAKPTWLCQAWLSPCQCTPLTSTIGLTTSRSKPTASTKHSRGCEHSMPPRAPPPTSACNSTRA